MNQVLNDNKVYTTLETNNQKDEKNIHKIIIVVCIFCICISSYGIYAKYEKSNKESQESLSSIDLTGIQDVDEEEKSQNELLQQAIASPNLDEVEIDTTVYKTANGETYSTIATLNIPSLDINYPVLSSTSAVLLNISLNKYWGCNPNEVGNFCIVGHNYKNGTHFGKLSRNKSWSYSRINRFNRKDINI